MNILSLMRVENPKFNFWALLLLSPAFILSYSLYIDFTIPGSVVIILPLVVALALFHTQLNLWISLLILVIVYGFAVRFSPFIIFGAPFFGYALASIYKTHAKKLSKRVLVSLLLIGFLFSWAYSGIQWTLFDFEQYQRKSLFYIGFLILLLISIAPFYFIRLSTIQLITFIAGFISVFFLIGFGLDWGYCLSLFSTLLFLTLLFEVRSTIFKPSISRVSFLVMVLYALLWNIPSPFLGMPGLGIYGAIYKAYPRLEMQDPLKHPFWREAGERYQKVRVGPHRNGLPPASSKLEFLLKRSGIKYIEFLPEPNFDIFTQRSDSDTFFC